MSGQKKSPFSLSIDALEQELMARSAQIPPERLFQFKDPEGTPTRRDIMNGIKQSHQSPPALNPALADIETWDLAKILIFKTRPGMDSTRGNLSEDILDYYEITETPIINNTLCLAALCYQDDLIDAGQGQVTLKTKNYGKTFNLCELEPFRQQPIATGTMGTAFLVAEDIIATAAHFVNKNNLSDLRFLFGYTMTDISSPTLTFLKEDIYQAIEIIQSQGGWALLKLDRTVTGHKKVVLSKDNISFDQEIYVLGHPLGLPLKFAAGATVENTHDTSFTTTLTLYAAHSGAPIFDLHTHQLIGMVVEPSPPEFRWTGNGWLSINSPEGKKTTCTKIPASIYNL